MMRRLALALLTLCCATAAQAQVYRPGFGFARPGFQFLSRANLTCTVADAVYVYDATTNCVSGTIYQADFAGDVYTGGPPSVSRASTGYAASLAGTYSLFAANTLRRTDAGAAIEAAVTESIRNNSMQGAVVGTPGTLPNSWSSGVNNSGLTTSVVGVGSQNGIDYIDFRFSGTSTGGNPFINMETTSGVPASQNQLWSASAFVSIVGGSLTNVSSVRLRIAGRSASAQLTTADTILSLNALLTRYSITTTFADAATTIALPTVIFTAGTGPVDFTLRIGWPDLKQWPTGTSAVRMANDSPIRTTGSAATRALDTVTLPTNGIGRVVVTFDDDTTQSFTGLDVNVPWSIPAANLNRPVVKRLVGFAS